MERDGILKQWAGPNSLCGNLLVSVNPYEPATSLRSDVNRSRRRLFAVASVSLVLYLVAFFLPVFDSSTPRAMYGYQAFAFAILSVKFVRLGWQTQCTGLHFGTRIEVT